MSDLHDLLGAYCTDALDPPERASFEAHLATCVDCRTEAAQFREVLAALADLSPELPPADLEEQVLAHAMAAAGDAAAAMVVEGAPPGGLAAADPAHPQRQPMAMPDRSSKRRAGVREGTTPARGTARRGSWLAVAAAGALLFASGVAVGWSQAETEAPTLVAAQMADVLAVASAGDASVQSLDIMGTTSRLVTSEEMDKAVFLASALPMPAKGMCYQVWRVTDDGRMLSAGAFTPDPDGHLAAVLDGGATEGVQKFLVTLEPPGGSSHPTGKPVGEVAA